MKNVCKVGCGGGGSILNGYLCIISETTSRRATYPDRIRKSYSIHVGLETFFKGSMNFHFPISLTKLN